MQYKMILFSLISMIMIGCSSQPLFDVMTADEEFDYYQGKEVVSCNDEAAKTILNFEHQDGEFFVFYLYVHSNSEEEFNIHPEQIYLEITKPDYVVNDKKAVLYYYAVDPEHELQMLDKDISSREDEHVASTAVNLLFGIFSVVHDVTNDHNDSDIGFDWAGNMVGESIDYEEDLDELNASKQFWRNETLRITTLNKDDKIGGLIYLPFSKTAKEFEIHVPVKDREHVYTFRQVLKKSS